MIGEMHVVAVRAADCPYPYPKRCAMQAFAHRQNAASACRTDLQNRRIGSFPAS